MAIIYDAKKGDFGIEASLGPGSPYAADTFDSLAALIRAFEQIDRDFASLFHSGLEVDLVLQSIEVGSLRTYFAAVLRSIPDETLKEGDWKKILGHFLVKLKYRLLRFCGDRTTVESVDELKKLREELDELKRVVEHLRQLPVDTPVPVQMILIAIQSVSVALEPLPKEEHVLFVSSEGQIELNREFSLSDERIRDLLATEMKSSTVEMSLKVKKPDYLGTSQWDVQIQGHTVHARIADMRWLDSFHSREVDLRPGDALVSRVRLDVYLDEYGGALETKYTVERVLGVFADTAEQLALPIASEGVHGPTPPRESLPGETPSVSGD